MSVPNNLRKQKKAPDSHRGPAFPCSVTLSVVANDPYAVAAFTCDSAAATSFKSGTTGMS